VSIVRRIIKNNIERVKVDELLAEEYEQAGYGGITLTKTPMGAQINLYAMRPGRVIGKRGRAIKAASERLEKELGLPNPQITVIEVEVPELNPAIMASRIANALERGVHFRRSIFWSLRRIMDSGALGCEILLKGPLRSARSRFEKVVEGYVPKSGEPALRNVKTATIHVKMKRGTLGVTVKIVPPDAKFPDKVSLEGLPDIEYQLPMEEPAIVAEVTVAVEPVVEETIKAVEPSVEVAAPVITDEASSEEASAQEETPVEGVAVEPVVEESASVEPAVEELAVEEVPEAVEEIPKAAEPVVEVEPAVEEPVAAVTEESVAEEPAVEEIIEAAEPAIADEVVEEEASAQEETPVEGAAVEPVVEESSSEEAVKEEPEAVEEPQAEPVITESAPEVSEPEEAPKEPAVESELVSEPEPDAEPEIEKVEPEPEVKPKPEADKAEEATEDQPKEEKQ
jgi:small subunit ribosomal protein S3